MKQGTPWSRFSKMDWIQVASGLKRLIWNELSS